MIISIIGSGNAATVLGKVLKKNGHSINEIAGRNKTAVKGLAQALDANACFELKHLDKNSEVYIITVKDDAVVEVAVQIQLKEKIVVHTCGSVSINALAKTSANYGVFYPLQSLRKELDYLPAIPFLVDGNNDITREDLFALARSVSENVINANDEARLQYHLSAVLVSNFTNHLFALAKEYCGRNNTNFSLLLPLMEETVHRLRYFEPAQMQTGPAIRKDEITMQRHLQLLSSFPQLKDIYEMMSKSIAEFNS